MKARDDLLAPLRPKRANNVNSPNLVHWLLLDLSAGTVTVT
jgi:hypothetical protein